MVQRRKKINKGQWQTQRERCQIADPEPGAPAGDAIAFGAILTSTLKRLGLDSDLWLKDLENEWTVLVGHPVARHARPGRFEKGVLWVFVDSSPWLTELSTFGKGQILIKLRERFGPGKIKDVILKLDPEVPRHNSSR